MKKILMIVKAIIYFLKVIYFVVGVFAGVFLLGTVFCFWVGITNETGGFGFLDDFSTKEVAVYSGISLAILIPLFFVKVRNFIFDIFGESAKNVFDE